MRYKSIKFVIEVEFLDTIKSAIQPLLKSDGTVDEDAMKDYQEFLSKVIDVFDENGFNVKDIEKSSRSETSYYYTAIRKDEEANESIKCVIFFRVSDHELRKNYEDNEDYDLERSRSRHYQEEANKYKKPESKPRQRWKFKKVLVNGQEFNSYDEALVKVNNTVKSL